MVDSGATYALLGAVVGVAGAAPMLFALYRVTRAEARLDAGVVVACGVAPFLALQLVLLAVALLRPEAMLAFGTAMALAFLAVVCVAGISAWRCMR